MHARCVLGCRDMLARQSRLDREAGVMHAEGIEDAVPKVLVARAWEMRRVLRCGMWAAAGAVWTAGVGVGVVLVGVDGWVGGRSAGGSAVAYLVKRALSDHLHKSSYHVRVEAIYAPLVVRVGIEGGG